MVTQINRRRLIASAVLGAPGLVLAARHSGLANARPPRFLQDEGTPFIEIVDATPLPPIAMIESPDWVVTLLNFQDPYSGDLRTPASPVPEMPELRYVGVEISFENTSDIALTVRPSSFTLHDSEGFSYETAAGTSGSDPKLGNQTVQPGERARGWMFFVVPAKAVLTEFWVEIPAIELRVPLEGIANEGISDPVATPSE